MPTTPSILDFDLRLPSFIRQMHLIGITLLLASVLYLLAANWFWLPAGVRMSIPMSLLAIGALISVHPRLSNTAVSTLHATVGLMIGLVLAVIGQSYQTGADSFWLFSLWALLLIPWLYRRNLAIFAMLSVVSTVALCLFFKQQFYGMDSAGFLISINALLGMLFIIAQCSYPPMRYVLTAAIGFITLYSAHLLIDYSELTMSTRFSAVASLFTLPALVSWHAWRRRDQACLALMASMWSGSLLYWLLAQLPLRDVGEWWLAGVLVLIWAGTIGGWLLRLFPVGRFHHLPLGLGAWLAGLIFSAMFLFWWGNVSMLLGLMALVVALIGLYKIPPQRDFLRHLMYCLMLTGQLAFMTHFLNETQSALMLLSLQLLVVMAVVGVRAHWLVIALQGVAVFYCALIYFMSDTLYGLNRPSLLTLANLEVLMLTPWLLLYLSVVRPYARAVMSLGLMVAFSAVILRQDIIDVKFFDSAAPDGWHLGWAQLAILLWAGTMLYRYFFGRLPMLQMAALAVVAVVLTALGYFELFVLLLGLAWGVTQRDKLIWALYLIGLGVLLTHIYYDLSMSFILKSITIGVSGLLFIALAQLLTNHSKESA